jgi:DNA-directed RNA polymerase subunit beta'
MHTIEQNEIRDNLTTAVRIGLASPETILSWSSGEVTRAETINYRTHRPERQGLFCERIFGPERDWECGCGRCRGVRFKGRVCEKCGVQVGPSRVRRKRMGHIDLAAPVVHLWFFKLTPSVLAHLFGLKKRDLERVIYYQAHIILDPGPTGLCRHQILDDESLRRLREQHGDTFVTGMGAGAIHTLLASLTLPELARELREELVAQGRRARPSLQKQKKLIKRLQIVQSLLDSGNDPRWLVLTRIPVIPPDLRPMVPLDSGNYATSDLNDLYRRVIQRNLRLRKLQGSRAPEVILRNEMRLLQQAVDPLFDNGRCQNKVMGSSQRPLKSLADLIHGKEGRFRQHLLGKRVDYSGRSVIVVGPELKLHQCGLPKVMAVELFEPLVIGQLLRSGQATTIHKARRMIHDRHEAIWDALEAVMRGHPVLLNRAPTLHRMGIQAFDPVLVEGNAIRLHPLVCKAFNADFDGDQMAVHLPLSLPARAEARERMMPASNIFSPANGQPIITPSKDMVLGCFHLTAVLGSRPRAEEVKAFSNPLEVVAAHGQDRVGVHTWISVRLPAERAVSSQEEVPAVPANQKHRRIVTTVGRILFNQALAEAARTVVLPFYDLVLSVRNLSRIIADCQRLAGREATLAVLETIKEVGFREATRSGLSFAASDLITPHRKGELVARAQQQVDRLREHTNRGHLDETERVEKVIEVWKATIDEIQQELTRELAADNRPGQPLNPIHVMVQSGARGSPEQMRQLSGIRGLMIRPSGEVIEIPVTSSFREGLTSLEYFTSTHGARKGLVDTSMKTSNSGHLTRRLVDVAQDVVVREEDCGTDQGIRKRAEGGRSLASRILGRVACETITHPVTDEVLVEAGDLIGVTMARAIEQADVQGVVVRSPLTCRARRGVCRKCYGMDRSTGQLVEVGMAVGVIAGQSIGEPGTQMTMRTFHIGGVASGQDITMSLPRVIELFEARTPAHRAVLAGVEGVLALPEDRSPAVARRVSVQPVDELDRPVGPAWTVMVEPGLKLLRELASGQRVRKGQALTEGDAHPQELLRMLDEEIVRIWIVDEIQKVYHREGADLDDKHVEVIVSRMLSKRKVRQPGDSTLLPEQVIDRNELRQINARLRRSIKVVRPGDSRFPAGAVVEQTELETETIRLRKEGHELPETVPAQLVRASTLLLGVTAAALHADGFLSAASFQETKAVLAEAALAGKVDELQGLKENVLLGQLVPAGTGFRPAEPGESRA